MEAIALHDFVPTDNDDLGFSKDVIINIIDMESDPNWYRAEYLQKTGLVPFNYIRLLPNNWYIQNCSRGQAEKILLETGPSGMSMQPDGAFILRRSEALHHGFSLSVKSDKEVMHFKILQEENGNYYIWSQRFGSINKLVEFHYKNSISKCKSLLLQNVRPSRLLENMNKSAVNERRVIAVYDYLANSGDELSFKRGDVIVVTGREDANWLRGRLRDREGVFPFNYVQ